MTGNKQDKRSLELYLHIPFCVRKCRYCDFLSGPADCSTQERYMQALLREIRERGKECESYQVDTIFIGGGTPSVVEAKGISQVMQAIRECYDVSPAAEITMEMNPGTVNREKLCAYHKAGINRLSIGLQSVWDEELQSLGRIHTFEQFKEAYTQAREIGFQNINVDVMSALPGQSVESWTKTLDVLLSLQPEPEHISAYSLILEEGTPLYESYERGELTLPDEDSERQMYVLTEEILGTAGYARYEISNYAKAGYQCRHNCGYWRRREYLGLGIGAASLMRETRFKNADHLEPYLKDCLAVREEEEMLSQEAQMEEFMFLGLRLMEGVDVRAFADKFGQDIFAVYGQVIERNVKDGLLKQEEGHVRLTKRGIDVSNYVMSQFLF